MTHVNIKLITELLKDDCIDCNIRNRVRCVDCPFVFDKPRVLLSQLFIDRGIKKIQKHELYFFLYNPHLMWSYPELPDYDFNNNYFKNYKRWNWVVHHEDGNHWNDNIWNLLLVLNTEHSYIHMIENPPMLKIETRLKSSRSHLRRVKEGLYNYPSKDPSVASKISETHRRKSIMGTHHCLGENNPMKDPSVVKKVSDSVRISSIKKVEDGTHQFITKNPKINYDLISKIKKWLDKFKIGDTKCIDKELCTKFGYCTPHDLRVGIQNLINREKMNEFSFYSNEKYGRWKKWFIYKTSKEDII